MTYLLRAARADDLEAIYRMAKGTGGGFTNLPADRTSLAGKLARTGAAFTRDDERLDDDLFFFVLENPDGRVCGTCQVFSRIGTTWPFYSYRLGAVTQVAKELGKTFRAETLTLSTDLDGASEVGGLYLDPAERAGGSGALLARGRYLFMARHRARFAPRTIAELRGAIDETGASPFWDGLGARFFGMSFREADAFNAVNGNQFIADLMPKHPIYTALLPESARAVMGVPHNSGRAALRMLENEGFRYEAYIDIFDGGPTVTIDTYQIATIRTSTAGRVTELRAGAAMDEAQRALVATGRLGNFRVAWAKVLAMDGGALVLEAEAAARLAIGLGDTVHYAAR